MNKKKLSHSNLNSSITSVLAALLCIVIGMAVGFLVLLVSLELDEVMNLSDRILVMYEGEIVGEFDPKTTTVQELGLYMAGARKQGKETK